MWCHYSYRPKNIVVTKEKTRKDPSEIVVGGLFLIFVEYKKGGIDKGTIYRGCIM